MAFLSPIGVLDNLNLKENLIVADFGCGSGGWVMPLAKRLKKGKVYAIDILDEPLSALKAKTKLERIFNIETIKSDIEKTSKLFDNSCDLVLMTNLLFQVEDKKKILQEGKRILKAGGRILVVDWKKDSPVSVTKHALPEEIKEIAEKVGLKLEKEFDAGFYHWGLILVK